MLSEDFIREAESAPKTRREVILPDKTRELTERLMEKGKNRAEHKLNKYYQKNEAQLQQYYRI